MTPDAFAGLIGQLTEAVAGQPLDAGLALTLEARVAPDGGLFGRIEAACHAAIAAGWMCQREAGGIRYGRVIAASPATADFSVDVVHMHDCVGPHHRHPRGEIDMIMPLTPGATFDGHGRGWCVYAPDSAHRPTVAGGEALVLYLLPGGEIEFTRGAAKRPA